MKLKSHQKITELALELCEDKMPEEILKYRKNIIAGSYKEDTTNLILRALHWHFYRENNSPIPQKVKKIFNPTSEIIFQKRVKEFEKEKDLKKKYEILGRIIHHIQDMTTPAHVLPIYHGPSLPYKFRIAFVEDYFENFLEKNVDKINFTCDELEIKEISNSFFDLYHRAAEKTLTKVLKINLNIDQRPYSKY
jgi:hypothetical protein